MLGRFCKQFVATATIGVAIAFTPTFLAAKQNEIPSWLKSHVGVRDGKIAPVVLQRARKLHHEKRRVGEIKNPCYMAMDATRPSTNRKGQATKRFYIICEAQKSFRAISSGYGNGRNIPGANFSNSRQCAKNFGNAEGSNLTTGGSYVTAEARTSFKGYIQQSGKRVPFYRTFLVFDGEGETSNARARAIGGHQAAFVRKQCRFKDPNNRHADKNGYVPFGQLVDYTSGRSNGCTTWSDRDSQEVLSLVNRNPTTLYIYPESGDIKAVARAVRANKSPARTGLYWNSSCLKEIGEPKFWTKRKLQPIIKRWRNSLPKKPRQELPICK